MIEYVSPTYLLTSIPAFVESITYRMLADGIILQDIRAAASAVTKWSSWSDFWIERASQHEALAEQAQRLGYRLDAAHHLVRASLCAHYGQFLYFAYPDKKCEAAERKIALFGAAASDLEPAAERLEIPFGAKHLPAYLRKPIGGGPFPCVILLGGLDAAKEDSYAFSSLCVARGLSTLAFDGPGQGEAFFRGFMLTPDFPLAVRAAVAELCGRDDIKADRIGVLGRSLGGFFAAQAAALIPEIAACVCWGALYDVGEIERKPPLIQDGYAYITGSADLAATKAATAFINLEGSSDRIRCPLYIVHGMRDNSVPYQQAERLAREAKGPVTLNLVPDSIHCCHDFAHVVRPEMASWLAKQLT